MNWYHSSNPAQISEDIYYQVVPDNLEPRRNFTQSDNPLQHIIATSETYRTPFDKEPVDRLSFGMQELSPEVHNSGEFPCMHYDSANPPRRTGLLGDVLGQMDRRGATMSSADDIFSNTEMIGSTSNSSQFEQSAGGSSTEVGSCETSIMMLGYGLNECSSSRELSEDQFMIPRQEMGYIDEEEMVLQDLQSVIRQMTKDSRICFRDVLYRLAKKSHNIGEFISHETLRYAETDYMEADEYEIDKAIAELMFNDLKHEQLDIFSIESQQFRG